MTRRHFGWIRKRTSGRWQIIYWHEGVRHSGGTFATKAEAQAVLAQIETDMRRGTWIDSRSSSVTVREYASTWLAGRTGLSIRTRELYEYLFLNHIDPVLGRIEIGKLTPAKIRDWNSELSNRLPTSAAKSYRLLSTMMRTAVADGLILNSPCTVKGASVEHSPERPIATPEEILSLAKNMPERMRLMVLLATWCQLRRGELLALRRGDINVKEEQLKVERSRTFARNGKSITKGPKTRAGIRELSIPSSLMPIIVSHLEKFCERDAESLLFTGDKGGPLTAGVLQKAWSKARVQIGRSDLHFHDLRHSGLTLAAGTGATTAELMHRAGHSSADAALRYQHATRERDKKIASSLETEMDINALRDFLS